MVSGVGCHVVDRDSCVVWCLVLTVTWFIETAEWYGVWSRLSRGSHRQLSGMVSGLGCHVVDRFSGVVWCLVLAVMWLTETAEWSAVWS